MMKGDQKWISILFQVIHMIHAEYREEGTQFSPICVEMCLQLRGAWHKCVYVLCILRLVYLVSCILRRVYGVNE